MEKWEQIIISIVPTISLIIALVIRILWKLFDKRKKLNDDDIISEIIKLHFINPKKNITNEEAKTIEDILQVRRSKNKEKKIKNIGYVVKKALEEASKKVDENGFLK